MKLRWKLLMSGVGILVIPLVVIFGIHFKLKHDVESYKKELSAKGEKLTIAELIPRSSTNENAARIFQESVRPFPSLKRDHHPSMMQMVAPGRAQASWKSDEIYDWDSKRRTNIWALIANDFDGNADALEELRNATDNGELVFQLAYEQGFRTLLPHLAPLKNTAVWLSTAAVYDLHEGNKIAAAENLKAALRFLENYKPEPLLISHLVRIACLNITFNATWEALQFPNWTDAELKEFQQGWAAISFDDFETVFPMERAMGIQMFAEARETGEDPLAMTIGGATTIFLDDLNEFKDNVLSDPKTAFQALLNQPNRRLWKWIKSYQHELDLLKMWQAGIEAIRKIETEKTFRPAAKELEERLNQQSPQDDDFLFGDSKTIVLSTLPKLFSAKIFREIAVTACALERFKLENGRYPEELEKLAPRFLKASPIDPMDGQPLRYHLNADGTFLLYSIGRNGIDDHGNVNVEIKPSIIDPSAPTLNNVKWVKPVHPNQALDWVWPIPATEEQIREWERHESGGKIK